MLAAEIGKRPAGREFLAGVHIDCLFCLMLDLDVTPNCKARLEEGDLD